MAPCEGSMVELVIFLVFAAMFLGPCMIATRVGLEEEKGG